VLAIFSGQGQGGTCVQWQGSVCVQWLGQGQGGTCVQYQGSVCVQWNTMTTITQSMSYAVTSYATATATTTTTGYATTQLSSVTFSNTFYTTQILRSYGTVTITSYIYIESYLSSGQLANALDVIGVTTSSGAQSPFSQFSLFTDILSNVGILAVMVAAAALIVLMIVRRGGHENVPKKASEQD